MRVRRDNAASRKSFVGEIYNTGEDETKRRVLESMEGDLAALHGNGYIHIHDLQAYGLTYNCLAFDILRHFPYERFADLGEAGKIIGVFDHLKGLFEKMGNEQSGGLALGNFDNDLAVIFSNLGVSCNRNAEVLRACVRSLILWCNNNYTLMGKASYYVTINIGLAGNESARFLAFTLLDEFEKLGPLVYKPNIVFKVHAGVNRYPTDPNYDLLTKSLLCTAKKMIPTYLLCDCEADRNTPPEKLAIVGCRTRIVDDVFGEVGAIGRGNICNISVNLPKLAFETVTEVTNSDEDARMERFKEKWTDLAGTVTVILLDRYKRTCQIGKDLFPANSEYNLWCEDFVDDLPKVFRHGTLSIGFIGLSEAVEIMTGAKYWDNEKNYNRALDFVSFMRNFIDAQRASYGLNFSLLAPSGEFISGRFVDCDKKTYRHDVLEKGYYTNSFHIDVDSGLSAREKIEREGPFHRLCNGGSITYVELAEAPMGNAEGLDELVEIAVSAGVHYLGFNFPQDVCGDCETTGVFDVCPVCGGKHISRIRRVSGYLEILDYFTDGKRNEHANRKGN